MAIEAFIRQIQENKVKRDLGRINVHAWEGGTERNQ